jgi:hypothetical protein
VGDPLAFQGRSKRGGKVEQKVATATWEQQLMVGILKNQGRLYIAINSS